MKELLLLKLTDISVVSNAYEVLSKSVNSALSFVHAEPEQGNSRTIDIKKKKKEPFMTLVLNN